MIFDTDVLIWASRGSGEAAKLIHSTDERSTSIISLMELLQGSRSRRELRIIQLFFQNLHFRILPLSERIGHIAVTLIEEYALSSGLQVADALIAATAVDAGEILTTANARHFRPIRSLEVKTFRPKR
ncbi:MAG: VapC toxin family PIN domain ribonuclease [Terriglobia bacterium]|nr:MAG: VapC toxin family PIN domain ribonuclease [Terriglobia bacterium]